MVITNQNPADFNEITLTADFSLPNNEPFAIKLEVDTEADLMVIPADAVSDTPVLTKFHKWWNEEYVRKVVFHPSNTATQAKYGKVWKEMLDNGNN